RDDARPDLLAVRRHQVDGPALGPDRAARRVEDDREQPVLVERAVERVARLDERALARDLALERRVLGEEGLDGGDVHGRRRREGRRRGAGAGTSPAEGSPVSRSSRSGWTHVAETTDEMPPRTRNSPRTSMRRGETAATRSSRM